MRYRGTVKGNVVVLEEGVTLPEGLQIDVVPVEEPRQGSPAALLKVWGSDLHDDIWDAVDRAIEELDRIDKERAGNHMHA